MAKKKKSQLKPVARGFATQSVPKKVIETPIVSEPESTSESSTAAIANIEGTTSTGDRGQSSGLASNSADLGQQTSDQFDSEKAEEQSLQNLVDIFQDRTEMEVVRTLKVTYLFIPS